MDSPENMPEGTFKRPDVNCLACQTYIGSVLFRTSAYTGAKQARRVPTGSKQDNSTHNDAVKDVSVLLESELIGPVQDR